MMSDSDESKSEKRPPGTLILYAFGLGLFSLVYLIIFPLMAIPSTFDPLQHCGVPLLGFVCVGVPVIFYGLLRWLTFPYIRPTARNFHIAAFALDMISVSIVIMPILGFFFSLTSLYRPGCLDVGGCLAPFVVLWYALPIGLIVIAIWSFISMGRVRRRGTGLIAWAMVIIYLVALIGYISYSGQSRDDEGYPGRRVPPERLRK